MRERSIALVIDAAARWREGVLIALVGHLLPVVQVRQEGLLGEGVVEDARLLCDGREDGVDVALARVAQGRIHVRLLVLEARVDVFQ